MYIHILCISMFAIMKIPSGITNHEWQYGFIENIEVLLYCIFTYYSSISYVHNHNGKRLKYYTELRRDRTVLNIRASAMYVCNLQRASTLW